MPNRFESKQIDKISKECSDLSKTNAHQEILLERYRNVFAWIADFAEAEKSLPNWLCKEIQELAETIEK